MSQDPYIKEVTFKSYHLPNTKGGRFSFQPSVKLSLAVDKYQSVEPLILEISAPRFELNPANVHSVFPPRNSLGEFDNVFPHIEINQSSLPWERWAIPGGNRITNAEKIPWLGLILLQDDELSGKQVSIQSMERVNLRDNLSLPHELSDEPENSEEPLPPIKVLEIDQSLLQSILPSGDDLRWLSHIRTGKDEHGQDYERAILVCNRMPRPGSQAEVHLVSFEHRLSSGAGFPFDYSITSESGKS